MRLNKEQYAAARHTDGPMLVLAGPGSGKTHLLVERIRMMIEDSGIPPENILVITFSKKAARQMQARFIRSNPKHSYPVTFGTFHAVFYHILLDHDPDTGTLITEEQQMMFVRDAIKKLSYYPIGISADMLTETMTGLISVYKNIGDEIYTRSEYAKLLDASERCGFADLVEEYNRLCHKEGLIDFDDMILLCGKLLYEHEYVLRKWQRKYKYILIDEFQDINETQYNVLRLLAGDTQNVFAVGDDDQSIYAFRGSRPELMKKFLKQYHGCKKITLTLNYRCCKNVIGASDTLIRHNIERLSRPMQRHLPSRPDGEILVVNAQNTLVQAAFVCDMIEDMITKSGYDLCDFAVLYRSDFCAKQLVKEAQLRGLLPKNNTTTHKDSINVMTAHASKGLEFRVVFIIGLQEGLFPHYKSMSDELIEEERRLMYVAMTRAIERLYLCSLSVDHGKRESRFVDEATKKAQYIKDVLRLIRCG